jgi:hypothetical protein
VSNTQYQEMQNNTTNVTPQAMLSQAGLRKEPFVNQEDPKVRHQYV